MPDGLYPLELDASTSPQATDVLVIQSASEPALVRRITYAHLTAGLAAASHAHAGVYQPADGDLAALAALTGTGYARRTGADTWVLDTPAGGGGTWGSITGTLSAQADLQAALDARQPLDGDLTALAALASTGWARRTGASTWTLATPTYSDVGADQAGTAAAAVAAHAAASDPHPGYLTAAEGAAAYVPLARAVSAGTGLSGGGDLSADRTLTVEYGASSSTACRGDDARLSDARTPTSHTHPASAISDSTATGRALVTATDAAAVQAAAGVRRVLTANTTYYVATTGSDTTGDGSSGAPWATIQKAYDWCAGNLDFRGYTVTIQLADGTYTTATAITQPWLGGGAMTIQGNTGNGTAVVLHATGTHTFSLASPCPGMLLLRYVKIQNSTSGHGIVTTNPGTSLTLNYITFGNCATAMVCTNGGTRIAAAYITIAGNATYFALVAAILSCYGCAFTLSGTPAFTYFTYCFNLGYANFEGAMFSGSASSGTTKYYAKTHGLIWTNNAGANFLPGGQSGSVDTTTYGVYA